MDSVLVIGGCGMLGSHIVKMFREKEPSTRVHVLDLNLTEQVDGVNYIQGDITNKEDVIQAVRASKPDVVLHTASPIHGQGKAVYEKVNVTGTNVILEVLEEEKVKALVYTSSAAVVFDGTDLVNANEQHPYAENHFDAYQDTKAQAERAVLRATRKSPLRACSIRPAAIFGEGDRQLIPGMLRVLEQGQTKYQIGDNMNIFDFTYVGNCAWAHLLAAKKLLQEIDSEPKDSEDRVNGQTFFITNGQPVYFWDFARAIWARKGHYQTSPWKIPRSFASVLGAVSEFVAWLRGKEPGLSRFRVVFSCVNRYYDVRKAVMLLDYKPIVDLQEGIRRSVAWADANTSSTEEKKTQ